MLRSFELCEPTSVAEASVLLARHGDTARIYAGGTELILAMKEGLIHYDHLVNVKTIPGLAGVRLDGGVTLPLLDRPDLFRPRDAGGQPRHVPEKVPHRLPRRLDPDLALDFQAAPPLLRWRHSGASC